MSQLSTPWPRFLFSLASLPTIVSKGPPAQKGSNSKHIRRTHASFMSKAASPTVGQFPRKIFSLRLQSSSIDFPSSTILMMNNVWEMYGGLVRGLLSGRRSREEFSFVARNWIVFHCAETFSTKTSAKTISTQISSRFPFGKRRKALSREQQKLFISCFYPQNRSQFSTVRDENRIEEKVFNEISFNRNSFKAFKLFFSFPVAAFAA